MINRGYKVRDVTPTRKPFTGYVSAMRIPADIDMSIFCQPIPNRKHNVDCMRKDNLLRMLNSNGNRGTFLALLRHLVNEMKEYKATAEQTNARKGIRVNHVDFWNDNHEDGWTKISQWKTMNVYAQPVIGLNVIENPKPKPALRRPNMTQMITPKDEVMTIVKGKAVSKSMKLKSLPKLPKQPMRLSDKPGCRLSKSKKAKLQTFTRTQVQFASIKKPSSTTRQTAPIFPKPMLRTLWQMIDFKGNAEHLTRVPDSKGTPLLSMNTATYASVASKKSTAKHASPTKTLTSLPTPQKSTALASIGSVSYAQIVSPPRIYTTKAKISEELNWIEFMNCGVQRASSTRKSLPCHAVKAPADIAQKQNPSAARVVRNARTSRPVSTQKQYDVDYPILKRGGGETDGTDSSKQGQHKFLLGQFHLPAAREAAFSALRSSFAQSVVNHSTYRNWWTNFERGIFTFANRGRPSSTSSKEPTLCTPKRTDQQTSASLAKSQSTTPRTSRIPQESAIEPFSMEVDKDVVEKSPIGSSVRQSHDTYTLATAEEDFTGHSYRETSEAYGISQTDTQCHHESTKRNEQGKFSTSNRCVFCDYCVDGRAGFAVLSCGHKAHWDKKFHDWVTSGPFKNCPKCKKMNKTTCKQCQGTLGLGCFETECYCSGETIKSSMHADELQAILASNNGTCPTVDCSLKHPGFCLLCKKLFTLHPDGSQDEKVYLPCCETYFHHGCWNETQPNAQCPHKCGRQWKEIVVVTSRQSCNLANPQPYTLRTRPRGCIGGRCNRTTQTQGTLSKQLSQVTIDSIMMPPPSLASRRSSRICSRSASINDQTEPTTPQFSQVSDHCHTTHTKHLGFNCAAKSAKHLPAYYDSTQKGTFKCPHCDALLLHSEAFGPSAFSKCCAKGRVQLSARFNALQNRPVELLWLFTNKETTPLRWQKNLLQNVLAYNNHVSFGHIQLQQEKEGMYRIVKCNNIIQYVLWDYNPPDGAKPLLHGQLFTIPATQAQQRLGEIAEEWKLDSELLVYIHNLLRKNHPMAALYETAAETFRRVSEEERIHLRMLVVGTNRLGVEQSVNEDVALPIHVPVPNEGALKQIHPGRLSVATEAGSRLVAQFYIDDGQNVIPSMDYEVVLMGRQGTGKTHMKWWHREIDPALFPLLFQRGQYGYEDGIPLKLRETERMDKTYAQIRADDDHLIDEGAELGEDYEFMANTNERYFCRRDRVSRAQFFRYMAFVRGPQWQTPHWLWDFGELAQLYTITFNNRSEARKVQYMKQLLGKRRLIRPSALLAYLEKLRDGQGLKGEIGRVYMTDEHFRGSRQFYQKEYANCMSICREVGKPDLLITMTMDPDCQELKELLPTDSNGRQQMWYDRPDIISRLFMDKLHEFEKDLGKRGVMGPVKGWFYAVEHQKRGLPHVHYCVILDWDQIRAGGKIQSIEDYLDEYICAEIPPNPTGRTKQAAEERHLYNVITTKNIHTCSPKRCLIEGKCNKRFPKPFEYDNVFSENAYPRYRRRPPPPSTKEAHKQPGQYGRVFAYKDRQGNIVRQDNSHVVAYNAFLSAKYRSHINVEFVAGDGCIKYLCKYVMKGADMAFVQVTAHNGGASLIYDEYHQIREARYITSVEAAMSLWGTPLVRRSHVVDELDVHLPDGHMIAVDQSFVDPDERENAICEAAQKEEERRQKGEERVTQLTAYFALNLERLAHPDGRLHLTYQTAYKKLWYNQVRKTWQLYAIDNREGKKLCRLKTVSPSQLELMAIRLLLLTIEDPTCWQDLRKYNDIVYPTFVATAQARGLLSDNELWKQTIKEAFDTKKRVKQCIRWLAVFFSTANLTKPTELLEYVMSISDKWLAVPSLANAPIEAKQQYVLRSLEWFLLANGVQPRQEPDADGNFETACEHLGLPRPQGVSLNQDDYLQLAFFRDDLIYERLPSELQNDSGQKRNGMRQTYNELFVTGPQPNDEQQQLIDDVFEGIGAARDIRRGSKCPVALAKQRLFMVTGEGGAGKTFTYNKIIAKAKAAGFNFLPMATTGIAAELLYEGQTVHKRLCRAKHVNSSTPASVDQESFFAEMLRTIDGMIIDEISMQHRDVLEFVDRLLRTVVPTPYLKRLPFGGKALVIGGDWKQLTPVIPGGGHLDQYNASVKNSSLFKHFASRRLVCNHRLQPNQQQYRNYLKRVGCGLINDQRHRIKLPQKMVEPDREALLNFVFPPSLLDNPLDNWETLSERAILCPLNRETLELNNRILDRLPTAERTYTAITTPIMDDAGALELENIYADVNMENLTRSTPPGVPEHWLRVKIGAVMMIIVNVSLEEGLCNGTRVQICALFNNIIRCKILTGKHKGEDHDLHAARFVFGGDPVAPHEGAFKCERIQFPLRPGNVMTINKSQGQTLSHVGVLLDNSQCFAHGQLYTALSRVRNENNIKVCTRSTDRRVKNIVMTELLDQEDVDSAVKVPEQADDPYPRAPPSDSETEVHQPLPCSSPHLKTPSSSTKMPGFSPSPTHLPLNLTPGLFKKIRIKIGHISKQTVFMIVNDRNGETNDEILRASAPSRNDLLEAQHKIHQCEGVVVQAGYVATTPAFGNLKSNVKYIAHATAPKLQPGSVPTQDIIQALRQCYENSLQAFTDANMLEDETRPRTIAFPRIGSVSNGIQRNLAVQCAFEGILSWLANNPQDAAFVEEIRLVPFDKPDENLYKLIFTKTKRQFNARKRPRSCSTSSTISTKSVSSMDSVPYKPPEQSPQQKVHTNAAPKQPAPTSDTQTSTSCHDVKGDGDCFYRAVCFSLLRVDEEANADTLRRAAGRTLREITMNTDFYPRNRYSAHEEFTAELRLALLESPSNAWQNQSLLNYAQHIAIPARTRLDGMVGWAQLADAHTIAILLRRPVVILRPIAENTTLRTVRPQWNNTTIRQRVDVYFPDGEYMGQTDNIDHTHLNNFTIRRLRQHNEMVERAVVNAIVIWYNGLNHFQAIVFDPPSLNASDGLNFIMEEKIGVPPSFY